ncbi:chymotrypsin-like protease CTRL-1 [Penaeus chinensis]|uniref:chymotrypsin-like protease CTRL-1 n=1 Tax=Penaeus chinensis TaxID=139456 RepID=UPI001FB5B673|nr:chymotrypsin-like protease CTRL-1 [Penaeus chinensis]
MVMIGAHDWCKCQPLPLRIPVKKFIPRRDYDNKTDENDIALLELAWDIPFPADNSIAPVCLPENPLDDNLTVNVIATGWGLMSKRKKVWPENIFNSMFCAGGNMEGTCLEDSGGPLVMTTGTAEGPLVQIGVTS